MPHATIELHIRDLTQLYNSMDPSPFHERDLDPEAEQFIVESALELAPRAPQEVVIQVDKPPQAPEHLIIVGDAIHAHFRRLSEASRRQLRLLFRDGRTSLIIGLACLIASLAAGELLMQVMSRGPADMVLRESLLIGGWVAMWRPLEIFLYDWWPIRNRRRVYDCLSQTPVRVAQTAAAS